MKNINLLTYLGLIFISFLFYACNEESARWSIIDKTNIEDFTPTGISVFREYVVVSDSATDRILFLDSIDNSVFLDLDIKSPMYINIRKSRLIIPSFLQDTVFIFRGERLFPLESFGILDGPTGAEAESVWHYAQVSRNDHRVHYRNHDLEHLLGGKGTEPGKLMYPSNIMFIDSMIWVVDSGNGRIQTFDTLGQFNYTFGEELLLKWPTGITAGDSTVFISDPKLNEIFAFDFKGKYLYSITEGLNQPTDL